MLYKTTCAIVYKGERVDRGSVVEMSEKVAANFGGDVVKHNGEEEVVAEEATVEVKDIKDMSKDELVAEAEARGISTSGSKAALIDRITLHDASPDEDDADVAD